MENELAKNKKTIEKKDKTIELKDKEIAELKRLLGTANLNS
jgi:hypothetical protein